MCSKFIYNQTGFNFNEWPEYDPNCALYTEDYMNVCARECIRLTIYRYTSNTNTFAFSESPFFVFSGDSETEKVFEEFSQMKNITCSAQGVPPPVLTWDYATQYYVIRSNNRLISNVTRFKDDNGSWTIRATIYFQVVERSDDRVYICDASNIAGSANRTYTVSVSSDFMDWKLTLLITGGATLSLLGLLAIPLTYILYRLQKKVQ